MAHNWTKDKIAQMSEKARDALYDRCKKKSEEKKYMADAHSIMKLCQEVEIESSVPPKTKNSPDDFIINWDSHGHNKRSYLYLDGSVIGIIRKRHNHGPNLGDDVYELELYNIDHEAHTFYYIEDARLAADKLVRERRGDC